MAVSDSTNEVAPPYLYELNLTHVIGIEWLQLQQSKITHDILLHCFDIVIFYIRIIGPFDLMYGYKFTLLFNLCFILHCIVHEIISSVFVCYSVIIERKENNIGHMAYEFQSLVSLPISTFS